MKIRSLFRITINKFPQYSIGFRIDDKRYEFDLEFLGPFTLGSEPVVLENTCIFIWSEAPLVSRKYISSTYLKKPLDQLHPPSNPTNTDVISGTTSLGTLLENIKEETGDEIIAGIEILSQLMPAQPPTDADHHGNHSV